MQVLSRVFDVCERIYISFDLELSREYLLGLKEASKRNCIKFEFEFVSFVMATIGGSIVGILPESKFPLTIMDVTRGRFINHDGISP